MGRNNVSVEELIGLLSNLQTECSIPEKDSRNVYNDEESKDVAEVALKLLQWSNEHNASIRNWKNHHLYVSDESGKNTSVYYYCYRIEQDTWLLRRELVFTDW